MTVELSFRETGAGAPLVILHGLFGSKRNWWSVARSLGSDHRVLTVDLRNHGESGWDDRHDYPAMADDVAALIRAEIGGPATVIGHSMGGKVAMILALAQPHCVGRLVVVDIAPAPSAQDPAGLLRAMRNLPLATFARRSDAETALAETIPEAAIRGFLLQNLASRPDGLSWAVNLDALERSCETIRGFPQVPDGQQFSGPTLFVIGGRSAYVQPQHHAEIKRLFPAATIEVIEAAGHWVHADAPEDFVAAVRRGETP